MAVFTMYLRDVMQSLLDCGDSAWQPGAITYDVDFWGIPTVADDLLRDDGTIKRKFNWTAIGLGTYPIFDEKRRDLLNLKIIEYFWNREIGQETVDLFRFQLRRTMNQIMPYFNQLYYSETLKFDPITTLNVATKTEATGANEGKTTSKSDSKSRSVASETPQTMLAGNEDYASSANDSVAESVGEGTSFATTGSLNDSTSKGYYTSPSDLLRKYRETFLNIDMMIIRELEPLFMQLWSNGDEFTPNRYPFYMSHPYGTTMGGLY